MMGVPTVLSEMMMCPFLFRAVAGHGHLLHLACSVGQCTVLWPPTGSWITCHPSCHLGGSALKGRWKEFQRLRFPVEYPYFVIQ